MLHLVLALAGALRPLHLAVARLDQQIQQAMDEHPDALIFRSFPGAGPVLAPRLLVAFGTNRWKNVLLRQVCVTEIRLGR